jgi:hypothetical protein
VIGSEGYTVTVLAGEYNDTASIYIIATEFYLLTDGGAVGFIESRFQLQ